MFHASADNKVAFQIETSLIFKTFLILGFQLSLVFGICLWVILMSRKAAFANSQFMGVTFNEGTNSRGELDLQPDDTSPGLQVLTSVCIASMFAIVLTSSPPNLGFHYDDNNEPNAWASAGDDHAQHGRKRRLKSSSVNYSDHLRSWRNRPLLWTGFLWIRYLSVLRPHRSDITQASDAIH